MKDFSKILRYAKPYSKGIAFAFLCLIVTSVITLVLPLIVRNMINVVVVEKNAAALNSLTLDIIGVIAFQMVFGITQNYILGFVGNRMTADFRMDLFNHIQSLSLRFFQERRVGEIKRYLSHSKSIGFHSCGGVASNHYPGRRVGHRFLSELETVGLDSAGASSVNAVCSHFR
jgi:subfamily B ATP-binding cassette protein MsbA